MSYHLNELALITGLTTRTLRNYLKLDILKGEKEDGNWCFTDEELDAFLSHPAVRQAVAAKRHAIVYDFLADRFKQGNRTCTIMDLPVSEVKAMEISAFFCEWINSRGKDITYGFSLEKGFSRYILSGAEAQVMELMRSYRERFGEQKD